MTRAALACAAAAVLAGCGAQERPTEADVYQSLAGLEEARLFTLQAGTDVGYPEAAAALPAQRRRTEHVRRLVEAAGGSPPLPFERTADAEDVLPGLAAVRTRADYRRYVAELDRVAAAAWKHARATVR